MNRLLINKTSIRSVFLVCLFLFVQTSLVWSADNIKGDWEITMDFEGRQSFAMLSISAKPDGTLTGMWGSDELSDVKFQDGKLKFSRTVGPPDRQFTTDYECTLDNGKLNVKFTNDWGEFSAVGARPKPKSPVLGQWDISFNVDDRNINAILIISENPDGSLAGKWTKEQGEHTISNTKFNDSKLTFTRKSKLDDFEFETNFEGAVDGDKLTGKFSNDMGSWPTEGKRIGTELIGQWELTTVSDWGTRTTMMRIFSDLTGRYEFFGGEIPMKDIKLDGEQLTFAIEMGFRDETFQIDFKGKLDGTNLKGQLTSDRGTSDVTGKKIVVVSPAVDIVGKWELTTTSERGTRSRILTINKDMTATYEVRDGETPVKDLKFENGQLTFQIERTFGERQFQMDFKGTVEGDTIKGQFTTSRGTREVTGKKLPEATAAPPSQGS